MTYPPKGCQVIDHSWGPEWAFENARHFFSALQRSNDVWQTGDHVHVANDWIYRGQDNANDDLMPTIFRKDLAPAVDFQYRKELMRANHFFRSAAKIVDEEDEQKIQRRIKLIARMLTEAYFLNRFLELADSLALPVQTSGYLQYDKIYQALTTHPFPSDAYEFQHEHALARHHKLPSRLLDWTRQPRNAILFAIPESMPKDPDGKIAVWAVHSKHISDLSEDKIGLLKSPRSTNLYLHSQDGVFLYHQRLFGSWLRNDFVQPFDKIFDHAKLDPLKFKGMTLLRKLTLPYRELSVIQDILVMEGITAAHLTPSFDTVASTVLSLLPWPKLFNLSRYAKPEEEPQQHLAEPLSPSGEHPTT